MTAPLAAIMQIFAAEQVNELIRQTEWRLRCNSSATVTER